MHFSQGSLLVTTDPVLRGSKLEDFRRQLANGQAQWLCFQCNDYKTNETLGGQGDTVTHQAREANHRNRRDHGHLLAKAMANKEEKLATAVAYSAGKLKRKRDDEQ